MSTLVDCEVNFLMAFYKDVVYWQDGLKCHELDISSVFASGEREPC